MHRSVEIKHAKKPVQNIELFAMQKFLTRHDGVINGRIKYTDLGFGFF